MSHAPSEHAETEAVRDYCAKALGIGVSSIEARFQTRTLVVDDGRRIVAKLPARSALSEAHLPAAYRIQEGLRGMGIPCAKLLSGPEPLNDDRMIVVHDYFAPGAPHSCTTPGHLKAVAKGLYALKRKSEGAPHNGLAAVGPCNAPDLPPQLISIAERWAHLREVADDWAIMHGDFKARNLRFDGVRISAIYDFDGLSIGSESYVVGYSSVVFSGGHERVALNFDLHTARAFIAAYEDARGERFTKVQREAAHGGMIHSLIRMGRLLILGGAVTADDLANRIEAFEREIHGSALSR
jgi:hypothetical protein